MDKIIRIIENAQLDETKSLAIKNQFAEFASVASEWESKAKSILVTDVNQKDEMKLAREGRLILKNKRVEIEKRRKSLKEESLREGQTIDAIARTLKGFIEPIEVYLEDQEKFAERKEAEERAKLSRIRINELEPYSEFIPINSVVIGNLSEEDFQKLMKGAKLQLKAKQEAEIKAEEERKAKEIYNKKKEERITRYLISFSEKAPENIMDFSEEEFDNLIAEREKERKAQRLENERIRKEQQELEYRSRSKGKTGS